MNGSPRQALATVAIAATLSSCGGDTAPSDALAADAAALNEAGAGNGGAGSSNGGSSSGGSNPDVGGSDNGGAGAGASAGSGGAGAGQGGSGATSGSGGATTSSGGQAGDVTCDPRTALCRSLPPACSEGQVPSVDNGCWGPCVPVATCVCDEAEDCPEPGQYTCHLYRSRCDYYVH